MHAEIEAIHPVLMSGDVVATIQFFAGLGFTLSFQDDPAEPRYAAVRRGSVELHLQWADEEQ